VAKLKSVVMVLKVSFSVAAGGDRREGSANEFPPLPPSVTAGVDCIMSV